MNQVSYIAINEHEYRKLLNATDRPDMVSPETAAAMFDCSVDFLNTLVKEQRIKRYTVPDHWRIVRYKVTELQELFKPER